MNFFPHKSLKDFDQWLILIDNQQNNIIFIIFFSDLDATGKPPSGILVGNLAWLGSYEECTKYVPGAHYCMAFFDTPIQPLTKVRMLSPLNLITFHVCDGTWEIHFNLWVAKLQLSIKQMFPIICVALYQVISNVKNYKNEVWRTVRLTGFQCNQSAKKVRFTACHSGKL